MFLIIMTVLHIRFSLPCCANMEKVRVSNCLSMRKRYQINTLYMLYRGIAPYLEERSFLYWLITLTEIFSLICESKKAVLP